MQTIRVVCKSLTEVKTQYWASLGRGEPMYLILCLYQGSKYDFETIIASFPLSFQCVFRLSKMVLSPYCTEVLEAKNKEWKMSIFCIYSFVLHVCIYHCFYNGFQTDCEWFCIQKPTFCYHTFLHKQSS